MKMRLITTPLLALVLLTASLARAEDSAKLVPPDAAVFVQIDDLAGWRTSSAPRSWKPIVLGSSAKTSAPTPIDACLRRRRLRETAMTPLTRRNNTDSAQVRNPVSHYRNHALAGDAELPTMRPKFLWTD